MGKMAYGILVPAPVLSLIHLSPTSPLAVCPKTANNLIRMVSFRKLRWLS